MNDTFSVRRLWYLLRSDFIGGYRSLLIVSGALAGITLVAAMIHPSGLVFDYGFHRDPGLHRGAFTLALFAWGTIASSRAFRPLHDKTRNEAYLLLPASALEKMLARLLAVTAGLVAYLLVFSTVVALVVESLNLLFFGSRNGFFNPFDPYVWEGISFYIVVQSLYFLGASWFRRAHFVKTTLAITLAIAGLAALTAIALRIAFADFPLHVSLHIQNLKFVLDMEPHSLAGVADTVLLAAMVLLPLACWSIAWLRVAEAQVSDGV